MKVLIINDLGTDTGGAERLSLDLRGELRSRGHDALLFSSSAQPVPTVPVLADETCRGASGHLQSLLSIANPFALIALSRLLKRFNPDIVHLRMFQWQLSPLILYALRGSRCLVHVVNYDLICPMNTKTLPSGAPCVHKAGAVCAWEGCMSQPGLLRAQAQRAIRDHSFDTIRSRLITNSHWVRRRLEQENIRVDGVVWNGVKESAPRPPLGDGPPQIGFAGRLVPKKGVDTLIHAFSEVRRRAPGVKLLIAGEGESRPALEALADELGVRGDVTFLGHLSADSMADAFKGLWVQAAPSKWEEPFGLVAAEAMMRGTPVVATDTGGFAEQVVVGQTGYTVPTSDVEAWTEALTWIITDKVHATSLGHRARQHAMEHFSLARFCDQILEHYRCILDV